MVFTPTGCNSLTYSCETYFHLTSDIIIVILSFDHDAPDLDDSSDQEKYVDHNGAGDEYGIPPQMLFVFPREMLFYHSR